MTQRLRSVALVTAASALGLATSGCHEILLVALAGRTDPPVHPPPAGRASADDSGPAAGAAAGRPFTGTLHGELASTLTIRHGFVNTTFKNVRLRGNFNGRLRGAPTPDDAALGALAAGQWHGQFSGTRNRANGKIAVRGVVLATFADPAAGRSCLRFKFSDRKGKRGKARGTITVLGGQGGASTLTGRTTVRVKIVGESITVSGRIDPKRGAPRGFTRACTRLASKFALQPLG